jgi:hypothetical protein
MAGLAVLAVVVITFGIVRTTYAGSSAVSSPDVGDIAYAQLALNQAEADARALAGAPRSGPNCGTASSHRARVAHDTVPFPDPAADATLRAVLTAFDVLIDGCSHGVDDVPVRANAVLARISAARRALYAATPRS